MKTHKHFTVTKEHLAILKQLPITDAMLMSLVLTNNTKATPFGGESLIEDLKDIVIGLKPTHEVSIIHEHKTGEKLIVDRDYEGVDDYLLGLYSEIPTALEVFLNVGDLDTGLYKTRSYTNDWKKVNKWGG